MFCMILPSSRIGNRFPKFKRARTSMALSKHNWSVFVSQLYWGPFPTILWKVLEDSQEGRCPEITLGTMCLYQVDCWEKFQSFHMWIGGRKGILSLHNTFAEFTWEFPILESLVWNPSLLVWRTVKLCTTSFYCFQGNSVLTWYKELDCWWRYFRFVLQQIYQITHIQVSDTLSNSHFTVPWTWKSEFTKHH